MKIYTKTGDDGTTGLFDGSRVPKFNLRVETYGTVDETNSFIGSAIAHGLDNLLQLELQEIQIKLMRLGSDLATPLESKIQIKINRITEEDILFLELLIDKYTLELPVLKNFILPGGSESASILHIARTVCRRAERLAVQLEQKESINPLIVIFINRLSDYLFTAARMANYKTNIEDITWVQK